VQEGTNNAIQTLENRQNILGVIDPLEDNIEYGPAHPLYNKDPYVDYTGHPDWFQYPEFYYNGEKWLPYRGSPGAYDPSTWVVVDISSGLGLNVKNAWDNGSDFSSQALQDTLYNLLSVGKLNRKNLVIRETELT
jgi:hypothetical protein